MQNSDSSYDVFPYESYPIPESHPNHLAMIGYLFGFSAVPMSSARVLEIGCSSGSNCVSLASRYGESTVVGIDSSSVELGQARRIVESAGIDNVELDCVDIRDLCEHFEGIEFDYIIAHGVLSWVSPMVQGALMEFAGKHLATNGMFYLSYNTWPGWYFRMPLRELMLYHSRKFSEPRDVLKQGKAIAGVLAKALGSELEQGDSASFASPMLQMLKSLKNLPDWYVFHDLLEEHNYPFYLREVIHLAETAGLRYLGDADPRAMVDFACPESVRQSLTSISQSHEDLEQYLDFFHNRMLRRSIFVNGEHSPDRSLGFERFRELWLSLPLAAPWASDATNDGELLCIRTQAGLLSISDKFSKAVFRRLAEMWPGAILYTDLEQWLTKEAGLNVSEDELTDVRATLFRSFLQGFVSLSLNDYSCGSSVGLRPEVHYFARQQAATSLKEKVGELGFVVNALHRHVVLSPEQLKLLVLCDGTRTCEDLLTLWEVNAEDKDDLLQTTLKEFAYHALLEK